MENWNERLKYKTEDCEECPLYLPVGYPTKDGTRVVEVCNWGVYVHVLTSRERPRACGLNLSESPNILKIDSILGSDDDKEKIVIEGAEVRLYRGEKDVVRILRFVEEREIKRRAEVADSTSRGLQTRLEV